MNDTNFQRWAERTPRIRSNILRMIHQANSGHPGGSLSMVEILMTLLAPGGVMDHDPKNPTGENRDRLVLSKGHGCPALYAVYSDMGYDITEEELMTLRHLGSRLQGHPDRRRIPYLEACTGSLGQGASIAQGIAIGQKLDGNNHRTYCIIGDGEMQEGQIWEVALSAPHHKTNNLTVILDFNKGQIDGPTNEVLNLHPVKEKWESFGWHVHEVDGHNYSELDRALRDTHASKPSFIVANTLKGKGCFMEDDVVAWHGVAPTDEQLKQALDEIASRTIGV